MVRRKKINVRHHHQDQISALLSPFSATNECFVKKRSSFFPGQEQADSGLEKRHLAAAAQLGRQLSEPVGDEERRVDESVAAVGQAAFLSTAERAVDVVDANVPTNVGDFVDLKRKAVALILAIKLHSSHTKWRLEESHNKKSPNEKSHNKKSPNEKSPNKKSPTIMVLITLDLN